MIKKSIPDSLKILAGIVNISKLRYSSDANNRKSQKPAGTTIRPEECVPESKYFKKGAPCELEPNSSCPPSCNPNGEQKQSGEKGSSFGKNGKYQFRYWHLLTALIVAGVGVYKVE